MEHSSKPIIATHSCADSLCDHPRNLRDDQLKALEKTGGFVGINFPVVRRF
ncbi:MAG: membrane dipeptidase [Acidaminococcaceae bacterium]|nr:membrane dipeptidase [Acidaminococcaceae bacterium]